MKHFPLVLILDNIRSLHNVGSIFRIADCAGVKKIYLTGITGYPPQPNDLRKPWAQTRAAKEIGKTSLGAEHVVTWEYVQDPMQAVEQLKRTGCTIFALEKTLTSVSLFDIPLPASVALIVGNEIEGVSQSLLTVADRVVEIPQFGTKESLNVANATAVGTYELVRRMLV